MFHICRKRIDRVVWMCYIIQNRLHGLLFRRNQMNREEKSALARQRILDAALEEFSAKGYEGASLNAACAEHDISKGIIYHHFKDKNELYLLCVEACFDSLTDYLREIVQTSTGSPEEKLRAYFDARLRFFAENPRYLGIFADAAFQPPGELSTEITERRRAFDALNASVLTALLEERPLRNGLSVPSIVEEFRTYMDFFNLRFKAALHQGCSPERILKEHEERCHQQLDILLHGVLGE